MVMQVNASVVECGVCVCVPFMQSLFFYYNNEIVDDVVVLITAISFIEQNDMVKIKCSFSMSMLYG